MGSILLWSDDDWNFLFFEFDRSVEKTLWFHFDTDSNCKLWYYRQPIDSVWCQLLYVFDKLVQVCLELLGSFVIFLKRLRFLIFHSWGSLLICRSIRIIRLLAYLDEMVVLNRLQLLGHFNRWLFFNWLALDDGVVDVYFVHSNLLHASWQNVWSLLLIFNFFAFVDLIKNLLEVKFKIKFTIDPLSFSTCLRRLLFISHFSKITFTNLNPVDIILLLPEKWIVVVSYFSNFNLLSQIAINRLYSPLTLPIVKSNFNLNVFIWEIKYFVDRSLNLDIIIWLEATETACALKITLKFEFLTSKAFDRLLLNLFKFSLILFFLLDLLFLLDVGDSLRHEDSGLFLGGQISRF